VVSAFAVPVENGNCAGRDGFYVSSLDTRDLYPSVPNPWKDNESRCVTAFTGSCDTVPTQAADCLSCLTNGDRDVGTAISVSCERNSPCSFRCFWLENAQSLGRVFVARSPRGRILGVATRALGAGNVVSGIVGWLWSTADMDYWVVLG